MVLTFSNSSPATLPYPTLPYPTLPYPCLTPTHPPSHRHHPHTEFLAVFEEITKEIVDEVMAEHEMIDEAKSWVNQMIRYSVPGGKLNRGLQVVHSLQALAGDKPISPENLKRAAMLGWCIEWVRVSSQGLLHLPTPLLTASPLYCLSAHLTAPSVLPCS